MSVLKVGIISLTKKIIEHYKKHNLGYLFGSMGFGITALYLTYLYIGPSFLKDIMNAESFIVLLIIPAFMAVGYLTDRRQYLTQELEDHADQLERSNQLKDLFIDIMTHDLTNPISVISGMVKITEDEDSIEDIREEIHEIKLNATRLEDMIVNVSVFAKLEGIKESDLDVKNLALIISSAIEDTQNLADAKGIKIENNVKGEYLVRASSFIENVFSNLLSNAVKYGPEKNVVTVDIEEADEKWKVMVKDQGEGIPDEYKTDIFNRFKRRQKTGVKGSGLGLAIVKAVVEMHNGNVWVEDNPAGGSIFCVRIPKAK